MLPTARHLPSAPNWDPGDGCIGIGFDAVIVGSQDDPRVTWAIEKVTGDRIDLAWPSGYSAVFAPKLEILDEHDQVAARAGDRLDGGCPAVVDGVEVMKVSATDVSRP